MHASFLAKTIDLALENVTSNNGGPFGALVTHRGIIIATGVNQVTLHNDPTAHAEIVAIRNACKKLSSFQLTDCIVYSSCEPCPMCLGALYWARPAALYFASSRHDAAHVGFDDAIIYEELLIPHEQRIISTYHLEIQHHLDPFIAWAKTILKKEY